MLRVHCHNALPLLLVILLTTMPLIVANICFGAPFNDLVVVTLDDAPSNYTSLDEWCTVHGWSYVNLETSEFDALVALGASCSVPGGFGIAVNSIDGIKWAQCLLTQNGGLFFPTDPGSSCAQPLAVACRLPLITGTTPTTTVTNLVRTTETVISPTETITDSETSLRLKTLPCGTSTVTGNFTVSLTNTTTTTVTETLFPTSFCPAKRLHICPESLGNLRLISGSVSKRNAMWREAACACRQDELAGPAVVTGENLGTAAAVLFGCLGGGAYAWIGYPEIPGNATMRPCLHVDAQGVGQIASCMSDTRLPVMCTGGDCQGDKCDRIIPPPHLLIQHRPEQFCPHGDVVLLPSGYYSSDIEFICSLWGLLAMDWIPEVYDADMIAAASACAYIGMGWVRSFNGSSAACNQVGYDGTTIIDNFVQDTDVCGQIQAVWCVSATTNIPVSTTGTVTDTFMTTTGFPITETVFTFSVSSITIPSTTVISTVVTTVRSLVLTPYTTTTTFNSTISVTETTITETITITTSVSTSVVTVSLRNAGSK